jgi:hypothetical protein
MINRNFIIKNTFTVLLGYLNSEANMEEFIIIEDKR